MMVHWIHSFFPFTNIDGYLLNHFIGNIICRNEENIRMNVSAVFKHALGLVRLYVWVYTNFIEKNLTERFWGGRRGGTETEDKTGDHDGRRNLEAAFGVFHAASGRQSFSAAV